MQHFGHEFDQLDQAHLDELRTLEQEGCTYAKLHVDEFGGSAYFRINFEPNEIVSFVDSMKAYNEFKRFLEDGYSKSGALNAISDERIIERVEERNELAENQFMPAAFIEGQVESLLCGHRPERYEPVYESEFDDERGLLRDIIMGLPDGIDCLQNRRGNNEDYEISSEFDVHDLLLAMLKPVFPDAKGEEYTPKHAGDSKRVDLVVPEYSTVIEVKYIRDITHAKEVADDLRIDIESYHVHPDCSRLIIVVWDEDRRIQDRPSFCSDLSGRRSKDGDSFDVEVEILP